MSQDYLKDFVLVGGTSLALQIGHRTSIDLDLFTHQAYKAKELLEKLKKDYSSIQVQILDRSTLILDLQGVKVDFIRFRYPFRKPIIKSAGLSLLDKEDIAAMKLDAITGRGSKKDFFDLYFLLQTFSLPAMMEWYEVMFGHDTIFHVWKSLTYFEDAESDGDPLVFDKKVTWEKVKKKIRTVVKEL